MYFETGQGSRASRRTPTTGWTNRRLECAGLRGGAPLLGAASGEHLWSVSIGPEYLANGKQIIRAGLEDHFCGKLLGLPMGCDVCYTNHAEADQDDMDTLMTMLGVAGCSYFMGVPGAEDVMLNYQSTSFHDAHYLRQVFRACARRPNSRTGCGA